MNLKNHNKALVLNRKGGGQHSFNVVSQWAHCEET